MTIGDNLKKIRKEKKLTQQQLAKKIGISRSYLSDVENNRYNPSSNTVESFAEKLNVSMFYLTTGEKTLADSTRHEISDLLKTWVEASEGMQSDLKKHKEGMQSDFKKDIEGILSSELSFVETNYLSIMLRFLKMSDTENIIAVSSIILTLIRSVEYKNADDADKYELNEFLKGELDDITKFFHDYFFSNNKEGN